MEETMKLTLEIVKCDADGRMYAAILTDEAGGEVGSILLRGSQVDVGDKLDVALQAVGMMHCVRTGGSEDDMDAAEDAPEDKELRKEIFRTVTDPEYGRRWNLDELVDYVDGIYNWIKTGRYENKRNAAGQD